MILLPAGSHLTLQVVAMSLTAFVLPKFEIKSILGPILAVLALSFVNIFYWDLDLFTIIPMSLNTRILSLVAVNGAIFFVIVKLVPGIEISGIFPALAAPILFSALTILLKLYAPQVTFAEMFQFAVAILDTLREYFLQTTSATNAPIG